ncbi:MAG: hypothetical protein JXR76_19930 [Deltaproteobacteria bacterium]|nr:hypothetical protein [Deltaproteobacteria bacterium]
MFEIPRDFVGGREGNDYVYKVPLFREMLLNDAPEVKLKMAVTSLKQAQT